MKQIRVHFVHLGSMQVSAEAAKSFRPQVNPSWQVTASTIEHLPRENDLATVSALHDSTIVVCMGKRTFDELSRRFDFDARKMLVWNEDRCSSNHIEKRCGELVEYVNAGSWVDIFLKDGTPTGLILPISWAADRGYWHHGVHMIVLTKTGEAVLEIRSKDIFYNPGEIDITLGGAVDAGEDPEHAAVRESYEELGLHIHPDQLHLLKTHIHVAWHPKHRKISRTINYVYLAVLDEDHMLLRPEFSEVGGVALCSEHEVRQLLRGKRVPNIGRLTSSYKYYNDVVKMAYRKFHKLYPSRRKRQKKVQ